MSGGGFLDNVFRGSREMHYRGGEVAVFVRLSAVVDCCQQLLC